jgi:hypothetical protein
MAIIKQLTGHVSEDTAYIVQDYPYGFRLRCTIRYWIETNKHGEQRFVSQTQNPKNGRWNTPKKSTYDKVKVMGLDEMNHVVSDGYYGYTYEDKIDQFVAKYELTDQQKTMMNVYRAQAQAVARQTEKPVYVS